MFLNVVLMILQLSVSTHKPSTLVYDLQQERWYFHFQQALTRLSSSPLVVCLQKLQQELEFLEVQEEYIKDEQKNLKKEFLHAQEEVKRIQSIPLVIGQFLEAVDQNTAIVGSTTGTIKRKNCLNLKD